MANEWVWAAIIAQQQAEADARRRREEEAARAKAEADADAARQAEAARQAQIAQQRQVEAASAAADEQTRLAAVASRAGPVSPADSYSPIGGSFFGSDTASPTGMVVGQEAADAKSSFGAFNSGAFMQPGKTGAAQQGALGGKSSLGDMFANATQPKKPTQNSGKASDSSGSSGASYQIF